MVDELLRGRTPARMGLADGTWPETLRAWIDQGYPTRVVHREPGEKVWRRSDGRSETCTVEGNYEEPVPLREYFGYDMYHGMGAGGWYDLQPLRGYREVIEETDEWEVVRDGAGASLKTWKHHSGTPEHIAFRMTTREIWQRDYRHHLLEFDPLRFEAPHLTRRKLDEARAGGYWAHYGHIFVWETMRQSMGDLTLYESMVLDRGWVRDFCEVYTKFHRECFTYLFEQVGLPDGIWLYEDLGYKAGLFASPKALAELIFPFFREMVDFFHGYDLPVVLHSCGSVLKAMPLIVEAGFDGLNPMERKAAGNDPFVLAEQYGDKLAFVGGFDVRIWETNDRELIRREMVEYLEGMKARGARLVFGSDHTITPTVRFDTYRYAVDVFREHMAY